MQSLARRCSRQTLDNYRFLAPLAGTLGADWRRIAHECGVPEERAELLLRSSATKAFFASFRSPPYQLRMDCVAVYRSLLAL